MSNQRSSSNRSNHSVPSQKNTPARYDIDSVQYFVQAYILHHKSQQHSQHTITTYMDRLGKLLWFLEHEGFPLQMGLYK